MNVQDAVASAIEMTKTLTGRYLAGFDDSSSVKQATNLPNHVRWNLGHCALTMHRVAEKVGGGVLPDSDFATSAGDARRFHTDMVSFGSKPGEGAGDYPPLARCVEIYNAACDRLAAAMRALPEKRLTEEVDWVTFKVPLYLLVLRMCFHNGFHTGQIADLRRAFGFKSIFA